MTFDPAFGSSDSLQLRAYGFFLALTTQAERRYAFEAGAEPTLGGNLLYAGDLNADTQALVVAGNAAGCATLASTADLSIQKQAIRDGIVDFLVTSLDEALRILKNEIRKRAPVAVCVGQNAAAVEREMIERGVQPDIVFAGRAGEERGTLGFDGPLEIQLTEPDSGLAFVTWQVSEAPARWMPKLDAIALECLPSASWEHRWIRLSPRYSGRTAMAHRALYCLPQVAHEIIRRFADSVEKGDIGAKVAISLASGGESQVFQITPGMASQSHF